MEVQVDPRAVFGNRSWHHFFHCPLNNYDCQTLKQYARSHELNDTFEVPGITSLKRRRGRVQFKKVLRPSFRALVACHSARLCMRGNFSADNFLIDNCSHVRLDNVQPAELTNKDDFDEDYHQFVKMTFSEVYVREPAPTDVIQWLKLINHGRQGYEYLICYHCSMMEYRQAITMSLYMIFLQLQQENPNLHHVIVSWLPQYDQWKKKSCSNALLQKGITFRPRNSRKKKATTYADDVTGVLKLIRNCWQHPCRFHEAVLTLIIEDDFPDLLADFQKAMFDAAQLGKLNLESVME